MIYTIIGSQRVELLQATESLLTRQRAKYPDLNIFRFTAPDHSPTALEEALVGQLLFAPKFAVVLDGFLSPLDPLVEKHLPQLAASANLYLFLTDKLTAALEKQLVDLGQVKKLAVVKSGEASKAGPNPFALADAFGLRDRRRAWTLLAESLARGTAAEEVFWKLTWKVKTLLLFQVTPDPTTLGFKPFVLDQTRRQSRQFKLEELQALSRRLLALWHESRSGRSDFELGLERLILEV
ncbi:MAG: hypothetical protein AAB455_03240 [Patescibacteria group bacterium]